MRTRALCRARRRTFSGKDGLAEKSDHSTLCDGCGKRARVRLEWKTHGPTRHAALRPKIKSNAAVLPLTSCLAPRARRGEEPLPLFFLPRLLTFAPTAPACPTSVQVEAPHTRRETIRGTTGTARLAVLCCSTHIKHMVFWGRSKRPIQERTREESAGAPPYFTMPSTFFAFGRTMTLENGTQWQR